MAARERLRTILYPRFFYYVAKTGKSGKMENAARRPGGRTMLSLIQARAGKREYDRLDPEGGWEIFSVEVASVTKGIRR